MAITSTASSAYDSVYLYLVGQLDEDSEGNKYIPTLFYSTAQFIKICRMLPYVKQKASPLKRSFVNNFILRYG